MANDVTITIKGKDDTGAALSGADTKLSAFKRDAIAKINEINRSKLRIDADIALATLKLEELTRQSDGATGDRKIRIDAETTKAKLELDELKLKADKLSHDKVTLNARVDQSGFMSSITSMFPSITSKFAAEGATAGEQTSASFGEAFLPAMLAVGAATAPVLTSALAGAIATAGVVGVAGLAAYLSKDNPVLKAAGTGLMAEISKGMKDAAGELQAPLAGVLADISTEFKADLPEIRRMFAAVGADLKPLADGLLLLAHYALPGFNNMLERAGPIISVINQNLPILGQEIGNLFTTLGNIAPEAAQALNDLFTVVDGGIEVIRRFFAAGAAMQDAMSGNWSRAWDNLKGAFGGVKQEAQGATSATGVYAGSMAAAADSAYKAAAASDAYKQSLKTLQTELLTLRGDERGFYAAVDAATQALKDNGRTLDIHTEKGRANQAALDQIARSTLAWRDEAQKAGASQDQLNGILQTGYARLVQDAQALGMSKQEAQQYAKAILGIPTKAGTTITLPGMSTAIANMAYFKSILGSIPRTVTVGVSVMAPKLPGGSVYNQQVPYAARKGGFEHGGVVGAAAAGGLRRGLTMVGEGGPELADLAAGSHVYSNPDTRQMLRSAPTGGGPVVLEFRSSGSEIDEMFVKMIRKFVRVRGGSVQTVLGSA